MCVHNSCADALNTHQTAGDRNSSFVRLRIFVLGFAAPLVQFVLFRELLGAYGGNEYLIGIALGFWLFFMGVGSQLARFLWRKETRGHLETWLFLVVAVLPSIAIISLRFARFHLFPEGAGVGLGPQIVVTVWGESLFCFFVGFLLARFALALSHTEAAGGIGKSYLIDSLGGIAGGLAFAFCLSWYFGHLQLTALVGFLMWGVIAWEGFRRTSSFLRVCPLLFIGSILFAALYAGERVTLSWLVPVGQVVDEARSAYGQILVSDLGGQRTYYRNGEPLFSTDTQELAELRVHFAMLSHERPKVVLVAGPMRPDVVREILRYPVEQVVAVEPDNELNRLIMRWESMREDPRVCVVNGDVRRYLATHQGECDVIVVDQPLPTTLLGNRYFTKEFAALAHKGLRKGGILAVPLGKFPEYPEPLRVRTIASVYRGFAQCFSHVRLIPADEILLLASDEPLPGDFTRAFDSRRLDTLIVRPGYFASVLTAERQKALQEMIALPEAANSDFFPLASRLQLQRWLSEYGYRFSVLEFFLLSIAMAIVSRLGRTELPLFVVSFCSAAFVYLTLLCVQILLGNVYFFTSLLVTIFMAGITVGTHMSKRLPQTAPTLLHLTLAGAFIGAAQILVVLFLHNVGMGESFSFYRVLAQVLGAVTVAAHGVMLFIMGWITGATFGVTAFVAFECPGDTSARVYTADFLGGAIASVLFATLITPILGIVWSLGGCAMAAFVVWVLLHWTH